MKCSTLYLTHMYYCVNTRSTYNFLVTNCYIQFVWLTFQVLPLEIRQMILKMLPPRELAKCRLICHQWNHEIQEVKMLMRKIWSNITAKRCIQEAINGNIEFFLALIEFAKDTNPSNKDGSTPLHEAAVNGHLELCRLILNSCEDKNPADEDGVTPLHEAALNGHLEVCRLILDRCEDKNPAAVNGKTPLDWAISSKNRAVFDLLISYLPASERNVKWPFKRKNKECTAPTKKKLKRGSK